MAHAQAMDKVMTMAEAAALVRDGASVAIGGHTLRRHPMAFVHELIRQGKKNLHVLGWNSGVDIDMLVGAGCVKTVETSYVGMGALGLARNYRREVEGGRVDVVEHTETTAIDMFRATSMGLGFLPTKTPLGTDLLNSGARFAQLADPFDGSPYAAVKAAKPDVAVIHAHMADRAGNVQLDEKRWMDNSVDVLVAKSSDTVIVTVEQIVSEEQILFNPLLTILPRVFVTAVVEAPFGAHPCCCDSRYDYDVEFLRYYYDASSSSEAFASFLDEHVRTPADHFDYLEKLGTRRLMAISRNVGVTEDE